MTGLQEFCLPDDVSDADLAHLAGLTALPQLELYGPRITDAGLAHLASLTNLGNLKIHCPSVKGPGLAYLRGLTRLKYLILDGSGVDDLAALAPLPNLRILSLRGTPLDDAGIARLPDLRSLPLLSLSDTSVGDAGLARRRRALRQPGGSTSRTVTDAGLIHLAGLSHLELLDLSRTAITDAGVAQVARIRGPAGRRLPGGSLESPLRPHTKITDASLPDTPVDAPDSSCSTSKGRPSRPPASPPQAASLPLGSEVNP